jgi:acyl carrier protein
MELAKLKDDLKKQIVAQLKLNEITPQDISDDEQLFGKGLGLDSIDALELVVLLEEQYGIKINHSEDGPKIFRSVSTIADYIMEHKKAVSG